MFQATTPNGVYFDTARIYAKGKSEEMAGRILSKNDRGFKLMTKAHPSQEGGLSPAGIRSQLTNSLQALQMKKVHVLYLHQPDTEHALTDSLQTMNELVKEGLIDAYGLSNYSTIEVKRAVDICKEKGYDLPVYFQGLYNPINRRVEDSLLPLLKELGIKFVAYNPLAAGMLTGKHKRGNTIPDGRFKENPNYLDRFYTDPVLDSVEIIRTACEKHGISMTKATYDWMLHHSGLQPDDGVLLGASKIEHLEENLKCCESSTELPKGLLEAFDKAWEICKPTAFAYWRGYSADQPGKDTLDPGASYSVKK